jgi:hypothetical protein
MAVTENIYTGDGSTVLFSFTFPYLNEADIKVSLDGADTTAYTLANATTVQMNAAPANGVVVRVYRNSDTDNVEATIFPGSAIRASDLNENFLQALYLNQETRRIAQEATAGVIADGSISTAKLGSEVVTTDKLAASAVSEPKIATGAVTTAKLGAAAVDNTKLATNAVATTNIQDNAITNPKLGDNCVNTAELADSAVTNPKIADSAITQAKIGTNVLTPRVSEINGGPLAGMRNAIINGNFDIWQRGTSFTGSEYGADRWFNFRVGSTCTMSRQTFTLGQTDVPGEPTYFCRMAVTSVAGAANIVALDQRIEDVRTLAGRQITISFWAKADAAKPIAVEAIQQFGTGGSPSAQVNTSGGKFSLTSAWQRISATVSLPSIASKTLGSDNNSHVAIRIYFDAGSDFNSRTDTLGQQSGTFDIAQVQVEAGPVATPFERRPIGVELALCERYYQAYTVGFTTYQVAGSGFNYRAPLRTKMRDTPTRTNSSVSYTNASGINSTATTTEFLVGASAIATSACVVSAVVALDAEL